MHTKGFSVYLTMIKWVLLLVLAGCKVSSFTTQVAPGSSLLNYHTFWLAPYNNQINITQPEYDNPENRALIDKAIRQELTQLGMQEQPKNAEVRVIYNLLIRDRTDTRIDSAVVYKPWLDTKQDYFNYTEGAFTLIFIDERTGAMIAQSQLASIMDRDPKKFRSAIPRVVHLMMKRIKDEEKNP